MIRIAAKSNPCRWEFLPACLAGSRFQSDAVDLSPQRPSRTGHRAVHAGTSRKRRLLDPSIPSQALAESAEFLRDLREQFAIWVLRRQPTIRAACGGRNGSRCTGPMPQGRATTSSHHWQTVERLGFISQAGQYAHLRYRLNRPNNKPRLMALLKRRTQFLCHPARQHVTLARQIMGRPACRWFRPQQGLAMYARAMKLLSAGIGDQTQLAELDVCSAGHPPSTRCGSGRHCAPPQRSSSVLSFTAPARLLRAAQHEFARRPGVS